MKADKHYSELCKVLNML